MAGETSTSVHLAQADTGAPAQTGTQDSGAATGTDAHAAGDASSTTSATPATGDSHGTSSTQGAASTQTGGDAHAATDMHGTTGTQVHGGGEHPEAFPPFDPSGFGSQILWLALSFAALYLLMSRSALPRIGEILEVRRDRIESDLAEADRLRQKTDNTIKAYEDELASARNKAHEMAEETRRTVKAETDAARAKQEGELTKRISAAEQRIQETKNEALKNVDQIAAQTAAAVVAQIADSVSADEARDAVAEATKE